jgi:hypothetical protein
MEKHTIKRDGLPPIAFTGERIASATSKTGTNDAGRWVDVEIYRTQGGSYVASVERITQWEKERSAYAGASRKTAAELIDWLKKDDGTLGAVSQEAVESAAKTDPAFAAAWIETVE